MAERTLRGARLGGQSFEDERGIEFAARQRVAYVCSQGHELDIPMAADAEIPRSEEHTSELQSRQYLVCRLLLEKQTNHQLVISHITDPLRTIHPLRFTL